MKEIGMEKLIELLNEWERERVNHSMIDFIPYGEKSFNDLSVAQVISKKYGFIKWLVENDKININEEWNDYEKTNLYCNSDFFQLQKHYSYYESLLMLLAIQDEPIRFLCEILK